MLLAVHITEGQPARGSEITTIRFGNGALQDRNIFVIHGQVAQVYRGVQERMEPMSDRVIKLNHLDSKYRY